MSQRRGCLQGRLVWVMLDSNVLMSAFGTRGLCEPIFAVCTKDHELFLSDSILSELAAHLPGKFKMPAQDAAEIIRFLRDEAQLVTPAQVPKNARRDPKDLMVLGTAIAARAN